MTCVVSAEEIETLSIVEINIVFAKLSNMMITIGKNTTTSASISKKERKVYTKFSINAHIA